ncbi:MAG: DUF1175 domain-containing protein [Bryobacteraceae bacterium]|nr:DUF1175 domain-containing protein [Bryobacteraceae bacterium]
MTRRSFLACAAVAPAAGANPGGADAFRRWFCWLAESLYFMKQPPAEVKDCSSLLRFAYREALRPHTAEWARHWGYDWLPPIPEPRVEASPLFFVGAEARHFADARHLMRFNTRKIAHRVEGALPADLLFFRAPGGESWHAMVFLGRSQFENSGDDFVVYHTGPEGKWPGEIRRPTVRELLRHPEPRWRPVAGNAQFLGVFRWRVLLGEG